MPHVLDNGVSSGNFDVLFPGAGCTCRSHILIGVAARADDWRIAAPPGQLERETAGGRTAGDFSLVVQRGTVDRAGRWRKNLPDGTHAKFRFNSNPTSMFFETTDTFFPKLGLREK